MEQELRFCTTSDGISIAYATLGEGLPLVYATGWPGHLSLEMETPHSRELIEDLAQGVTLIRYDMRGSGLSEHDPGELSFDRCVLDLEAVVDHLKLDSFALLSLGFLAGPISIAYAGKHPERISHLIMSDAYARGVELMTPERSKVMVDYISLYGFPIAVEDNSTPEDVKKIQDVAKIQREAAPLEVQGEVARMMVTVDVSGYLDKLSMPTLIMHGRDDRIVPFGLGRNLAASLPEAKFVPFDESVATPWRKREQITNEIRRFLGIEVKSKPKPAHAPAVDVYTIMFTDIEGSTELTQRLGDAKAQEVVHAHNQIVRDALRAHGCDEIKHTGDGMMASFSSSSGAISCAVAIQQAVVAHVEKHPDMPLSIYIGLNAGEPVAEDDPDGRADLFGTAVQLASRICDKAGPGQILVSNVVRELAAGKGFLFSDLGESALRGFDDAVRLYEVRWQQEPTAGGGDQAAPVASATIVSKPADRAFGSGRYVVVKLLGQGAQKSVYLVDDTTLGRQSALSILNPALLDRRDKERIKQEAQTMAQFGSQPNIVTVYDYGEEDGAPFIVCEYVSGGELREELDAAAGPLSLKRALTVAIDICRALSFAHRRNIVHRDLKPANVWLTEERTAKLGDFGIALSLGRTRLTMPGSVTGTATYMAPEQASGGDVDARSDLYAFGALLYELVTGRPPFVGDDPNAIIYQHINTKPESPAKHNASVPPDLERLIMRLLAKTKTERPSSAEDVLTELERSLADIDTMRSAGTESLTAGAPG